MKDSDGQILLLSALIACAGLITLAVCLHSVSAAEMVEDPALQRETLDNVIWAQDTGLCQVAGETGRCQWNQREELASRYMSGADRPISSISSILSSHGIAYSFTFNETLASAYLEENDLPLVENIGGILVKRETDNASVCGCACDVMLTDGLSRYRVSKIETWSYSS